MDAIKEKITYFINGEVSGKLTENWLDVSTRKLSPPLKEELDGVYVSIFICAN